MGRKYHIVRSNTMLPEKGKWRKEALLQKEIRKEFKDLSTRKETHKRSFSKGEKVIYEETYA